MKVIYDVDKQDYINFNLYYCKNSKLMKNVISTQRFLTPVIIIFLISFLKENLKEQFFIILGICAIFSIAWVILYPKYFTKNIIKKIEMSMKLGNDFNILGKHIMTIDEKGILDIKDDYEMKTKWDDIKSMEIDMDYIYMCIGARTYIIPKRCFENKNDMDKFMNKINEYRNSN